MFLAWALLIAAPDDVEMKIWSALTASAPAIDQCTDAYTGEFPNEAGKVQIDCTIAVQGVVAKVVATTTLQGARNLRPCLERVAKTWRLPPPKNPEKMTLMINVKKGVKFALRKPGTAAPKEEAPPPQNAEEGFLQFLPSNWVEDAK
jgi:hypothetical protein